MVSDQNPFAGGVCPFPKWMTYLLAPLYFFPSASTSEVGYTASCGRLAPRPMAVMNARWRYAVPYTPAFVVNVHPLYRVPASLKCAMIRAWAAFGAAATPRAAAGSALAGSNGR